MNDNLLLEKLKAEMRIEPEKVSLSLENFIREYTEKLEREGLIFGLSGGIDSAVIAVLCQQAVSPPKTLALIMPDRDSKKEHLREAQDLARELSLPTKLINITPYLQEMGIYEFFPFNKVPSWGGLKDNLIKRAYQFYTRKTGEIPSPDLIPGLDDEETLEISYQKLDLILLALEKGWTIPDLAKALKIREDKIINIQNLIQKSEHLRKSSFLKTIESSRIIEKFLLNNFGLLGRKKNE